MKSEYPQSPRRKLLDTAHMFLVPSMTQSPWDSALEATVKQRSHIRYLHGYSGNWSGVDFDWIALSETSSDRLRRILNIQGDLFLNTNVADRLKHIEQLTTAVIEEVKSLASQLCQGFQLWVREAMTRLKRLGIKWLKTRFAKNVPGIIQDKPQGRRRRSPASQPRAHFANGEEDHLSEV